MGEVYGVFAAATAVFALISWLAWHQEPDPAEGISALALVAAFFMGVFTWMAWSDHQECRENPAYRAVHPDDC